LPEREKGMSDTKERILLTALRLFAREGYAAVSVSDIAGELGFSKAALYRHFRSKRDVFDTILTRMEARDLEQARACGLPEEARQAAPEAYADLSLDDVVAFSKAMFRYWTEDPFATAFRRMLTLEQYRDGETGKLWQQYLGSGPLQYLEDLFVSLAIPRPKEAAAEFYAPMLLSYSLYDAGGDPEAVTRELDALLDRGMEKLKAEQRQKESRTMQIVIRNEKPEDYRAVENLVRESFWNVYRPGCYEHFVLHKYRDKLDFVQELDLVMEKDGVLIGQNMFVKAVIRADDGRQIPILTMGPICIVPALQRRGYGKLLLDHCLERAAEMGFGALCFEGNIRFYGHCGLTYAREFGIRYHDLPEGADDSFFLCRELIPGYLQGVTGVYAPPEGYFAAERFPEEFADYEAGFPPKEKKKLPGQLE